MLIQAAAGNSKKPRFVSLVTNVICMLRCKEAVEVFEKEGAIWVVRIIPLHSIFRAHSKVLFPGYEHSRTLFLFGL